MAIRNPGNAENLASIDRPPEMLRYVLENPYAESPDEHLVLLDSTKKAIACSSLWWNDCPSIEGENVACVGHFFASDQITGAQILEEVRQRLLVKGATFAIGPMNGNTWRKYRFVTSDSEEPPFFLEPENPSWWPDLWEWEGFSPLAGYHSSVIENLSESDPRIQRAEERLNENGVRIRELDIENYSEELKRIYEVSKRSFALNYLYTPLPLEDFLGLYLPFKDYVDPRFALIAEREGVPVGFVFCTTDLSQIKRSGESDTLIIKTLAVLPSRENAGLGAILVDRMRRAALDSGLRRVIHALMHDQNKSANIGKNSAILRRYTLFGLRLDI